MKDMGELHYCLGVSVVQDNDQKCLWLHQEHYIQKILKRFGMLEAKPVATPADTNVKLEKNDGISSPVDQLNFQSLIGSLLYAAVATRPDIAQAVSMVAKYSASPTEAHLTAAKRILRYLKGTQKLAVKYQKMEDDRLLGYSDADWAGDKDERHSTTGNVFLLAGGPLSWFSKKQEVVALSTTEAEYIALASATREAIWLRNLLAGIGAEQKIPTVIFEDNQGAIAIAKNPSAHARTKHIDIKYHYTREMAQKGVIQVEYCSTEDMLADVFTKPLTKAKFQSLITKIGLHNLLNK